MPAATATAPDPPVVEAPAQRRWPWQRAPRDADGEPAEKPAVPPLSPRLQLLRGVLLMVCALALSLFLQLTVVSRFQEGAAQQQKFDQFRAELALGTAPVGPTILEFDEAGNSEEFELALGHPVAYLEIPALELDQVVLEGTTSGVLFDGPGHRRDTPLPGQPGVSIVMGRAAAYGGPFGSIGELTDGDQIIATTGQGTFTYSVIGVRREGDPLPPPIEGGTSRLVLATADGPAFLPNGVLRVDAQLDGETAPGSPRIYTSATLPQEERAMEGDFRTLWALALWLQVLLAVTLAAIWSWSSWGRAQTWVVFLPLTLLVGLATSGEVARLLPNLL